MRGLKERIFPEDNLNYMYSIRIGRGEKITDDYLKREDIRKIIYKKVALGVLEELINVNKMRYLTPLLKEDTKEMIYSTDIDGQIDICLTDFELFFRYFARKGAVDFLCKPNYSSCFLMEARFLPEYRIANILYAAFEYIKKQDENLREMVGVSKIIEKDVHPLDTNKYLGKD